MVLMFVVQITSSGTANSAATRRPSLASGGCTTRHFCGISEMTAWRCFSTPRRLRSTERCVQLPQ